MSMASGLTGLQRCWLAASEVVVIVQARTGSSRLPGKVLADVGGMPMLEFMLRRLAPLPWPVVVATSDQEADTAVVSVARASGARVVRGPEGDVLARYMVALQAHPASHVVRLTADCPLADPRIISAAVQLHLDANAAYTSNVLPRTFPKGLDCEVMSAEALRSAASEANATGEREHVTPFLYRRPERFKLANLWCEEDLGDERWTVDTADDLDFVRSIVALLGETASDAPWEAVRAVTRPRPETYGPLRLRPARLGDLDRLLVWRNDEQTVRFSGTQRGVTRDEHRNWFVARLADPATRIWVATEGDLSVGMVRLDVESGLGEISVVVAPEFRGRGFGSSLLETATGLLRGDQQCERVLARVDPANAASIRIFEKHGFTRMGTDRRLIVLEWKP